jgi:prepilin-type N-terminal cleavage/methylation domain-containing protein
MSNRNQSGFTLIELMIVIAIIAIIAAIAIPNLLAARLSANETAAIATLRNIISAQAQFQQSAKADEDNDGTGEYGGFVELSGADDGRMAGVLVPPVLSGAFRILNAAGEVSRSGYFFKVFLPDAGGAPLAEPQTGFTTGGGQNPDLSETTWCCYAWPVNYNQSGNRTFFTNQGGDVVATEDEDYSGTTNGPEGDAAFQTADVITGAVAIGIAGADTNIWKQVN